MALPGDRHRTFDTFLSVCLNVVMVDVAWEGLCVGWQ